MNYTAFVAQGKPLWDRFEKNLKLTRRGFDALGHEALERLAIDYRRVLHDHAMAASRFEGTAIAHRLRRLTLEGTHLLTRDEQHKNWHWRQVLDFFLTVYPRTFQRLRPLMIISLELFLLLGVFGLALSVYRPSLGVAFVGQEAVEGLREQRLWTESLTTTIPPAVSSSRIATNNMSVAITAWTGGITAGALTLWVLAINGLMLGAVIGITLHYSMFGQLGEFIAAHGPLEISLILVAAAAGLELARGLVVAEDRPRGETLRRSALDSLILLAGSLPWFLLLGAVEGFISPAPEFPLAFKVTLGIALEILFLSYVFRPVAVPSHQEAS